MNWMNHHQVLTDVLKKRFGDRENLVGIEIGTFCGDSARAILWALPNCKKLYTIDPWRHVDGAEFEAGELQPYHDNNKAEAFRKFASDDIKDRIEVLEMTSEEAHKYLIHNLGIKGVDFVWIDGNHERNGVQTDISLYYPLVESNGLIGGHDFGQIPYVTETVFKFFDKSLWSGNDYTWWHFVD